MIAPISCSLGYNQCKYEFAMSEAQANQAYRVAETFSPAKAPYGIPMYPYVWVPMPKTNTIRLEMGRRKEGKRVVALFTIKHVANRPGVIVHVAVFEIDEALAAQSGVDPEFASAVIDDLRLHTEAFKHFRGQLLRLDLGLSNGYIVGIPDVPPPPPADELPPPHDFEDAL